MPDKWEYPWFAALDLAFHMVPYARIDPSLCQATAHDPPARVVRHPNGQLAAYSGNLAM